MLIQKVKIKCPIHGEFEQYPTNHLSGRGCPNCTNNISNQETEIFIYINDDINIECDQSNRKIIKPYELDIVIKSLKLAFEFNGKYWHSDEKIIKRTKGKHKTAEEYHDMKTKKCEKKGYKLIHIFEEDYIDDKEKVLNNIKNIIEERKNELKNLL